LPPEFENRVRPAVDRLEVAKMKIAPGMSHARGNLWAGRAGCTLVNIRKIPSPCGSGLGIRPL